MAMTSFWVHMTTSVRKRHSVVAVYFLIFYLLLISIVSIIALHNGCLIVVPVNGQVDFRSGLQALLRVRYGGKNLKKDCSRRNTTERDETSNTVQVDETAAEPFELSLCS